jgi:hypothetical protein
MSPVSATWNAYSDAYHARYGVKPTWNGTVGGQLANFVKRVPVSEAPAIAANYVKNGGPNYARDRFPIGMLLMHAEKHRTDWQTKTTVSAAETRAADADVGLRNQLKRLGGNP